MQRLRAYFRQQMAARIEALDAALRALSAGNDPAALESVATIALSLRGAGASYGYPEISFAAAALEQAEGSEIVEAVEILLETARELVDTGEPEDPPAIASDRDMEVFRRLSTAKESFDDPVGAAIEPARRPRRSVLLVEDDELIAAIVEAILNHDDLEVRRAWCASDAVELARRIRPALMLIDCDVRDLHGLDVLSAMRTATDLDRTPIVMLASGWDERGIVRAFELGAADCITKPFSPAELIARIRQHAGRREPAPTH